jgi:hypothetical protein
MKGEMPIGGKAVHIGEPGSVDWEAPGPPYGYTVEGGAMQPYLELARGTGFLPLFAAYWATKNEAYLTRWVDYMDDWALNARYLHELHPIFNHDNGRYPDVTTLRAFAGAALALPVNRDAVAPQAFARILRKLATESVLNDVVYYRSAGGGWVPGAGRMLFPMLIDEFKVAPIYFRETRRRNLEDLNTVQTMRDGTEPHQWPGYNWLGVLNMGALRLMDARENLPPWAQPVWEKELHSPEWRQELIDNLGLRARYLLHWVTPAGEYPLTTHHQPPSERGKVREMLRMIPEVLDDEPTAKLYSTLYGDGRTGPPEWTADWFPYGGYSIARTGWGLGEGYGSMFCSTHPGQGSAGANCKNNTFSLHAFGADLLDDDTVHGYIGFHATSPINVDGKRQDHGFCTHVNGWPCAHKGEMITGWAEPAPWRWHASTQFNLIEGVYTGVYANDRRNRSDLVDDVTHQRLAIFAREAGLWILTDRLKTSRKHAYEQTWFLPVRRKEFGGFKPEDIVTDAATRTIKTRRTHTDKYWSWDLLRDVVISNVNLSMYQFTDAALAYTTDTKNDDSEMYAFQRIGGTWQGEGDQQIVTALFPRPPTTGNTPPTGAENDLAAIQSLAATGADGFEAVTPGGDRVSYLAARGQAAALTIGDVQVIGEALLVTHRRVGEVRGLALGARGLAVKGKRRNAPYLDFEFALDAKSAVREVLPIYRPISPVQILPEADVFTATLEVSLECGTTNVVMTYTLDGTDPTPQSTRYTGPFTIDRSVVVKTRAYRPAVDRNPPETSGTMATPVSHALFTKRLPSMAADANPQTPGLECEYYEDFWKDMWLDLDALKPRKKDAVANLFDLAVIPEDNRPVGAGRVPCEKSYALRYTGFLKVPADGVYTLHAPRELVYNDTMAGYELQVYLGRATYLDNSIPRREADLSYWYPATRLHGLGTWSVPLQKGFHELKIVYIDFRMDGARRLNQPAPIHEYVWIGERPALLISGPGLAQQSIPAAWLWR